MKSAALPILLGLVAAAHWPSQARAQNGTWRVLQGLDQFGGGSGSLCIHSLLLPNNRLYPILNPNTGGMTATEIDLNQEPLQAVVNGPSTNAFCAGHAQAANGQVWMIGGDAQLSNFTNGTTFLWDGLSKIRTYNPVGQVPLGDPNPSLAARHGSWNESFRDMDGGKRWYPTVVTMYDGDIIIFGGTTANLDFDHLSAENNNPTYEFYPPRFGGAFHMPVLDWAYPHNLYPISFQLPSGGIFLFVSNKTLIVDPTVPPGASGIDNLKSIADMPELDHAPWIYPHTPTGTMLPMSEETGYVATVMVCGGSKNSTKDASDDCYSITPDEPNAKWKAHAKMPHARLMPDSVLLPDGKILYTNGASWGQAGGNAGQCMYAAGPVHATDLYDPAADTWTTIGQSTVSRLYHSGALLLSDATVITTGSEMANYLDYWGTDDNVTPPTDPLRPACFPNTPSTQEGSNCTSPYEYRIEHFTPPYLLTGAARPQITSAPASAGWNATVTIGIKHAGAAGSDGYVARVTLVRYATTTHSTNTDQRFLEPKIIALTDSALTFRVPPNGKVAPPGNYHVFVLSKAGVPSVGATVLIGPATGTGGGGSGTTATASTRSGASKSAKVRGALLAVALGIAILSAL
ncbi:hypothetical protein DFJ73DRAFT_817500 [Zopfochytrium polystomum]|nr:hypothetical protein DFJ73DRAFT_817500 [Zopfochytrium polystomum]